MEKMCIALQELQYLKNFKLFHQSPHRIFASTKWASPGSCGIPSNLQIHRVSIWEYYIWSQCCVSMNVLFEWKQGHWKYRIMSEAEPLVPKI